MQRIVIESSGHAILSVRAVVQETASPLTEATVGSGNEFWSIAVDHRASEPMSAEQTAAYVAERYLLDNPAQLEHLGAAAVTAAVLRALQPYQEGPTDMQRQ